MFILNYGFMELKDNYHKSNMCMSVAWSCGGAVVELLRQHVSGCCGSLRARTCRTAPQARARAVSAYGSGRWRERAQLAPFGPLSARAAHQ